MPDLCFSFLIGLEFDAAIHQCFSCYRISYTFASTLPFWNSPFTFGSSLETFHFFLSIFHNSTYCMCVCMSFDQGSCKTILLMTITMWSRHEIQYSILFCAVSFSAQRIFYWNRYFWKSVLENRSNMSPQENKN